MIKILTIFIFEIVWDERSSGGFNVSNFFLLKVIFSYPSLHRLGCHSWLCTKYTREMWEAKKTWFEVLPSLFNLLVENADGIIDDTSLQRILEWLKNVCKNDQQVHKLLQCGTVEFMSKDPVFSNPESAAFFLTLFGFLAARAEIFHSFKSGGDGDFVAQFLDKPRTDSNLWNEGIVRNGYFQALSSLTEHKNGILWLRNTGRNLL